MKSILTKIHTNQLYRKYINGSHYRSIGNTYYKDLGAAINIDTAVYNYMCDYIYHTHIHTCTEDREIFCVAFFRVRNVRTFNVRRVARARARIIHHRKIFFIHHRKIFGA